MNEIVDDILVRDFRKSDLQGLLGVARLSFTQELEIIGFDEEHVKKMVNQMFGIAGRIFLFLSKLFGKEPIRFLVAEVGNRVVGTIGVSKRGEVGYVSTLMVHPKYRRKGVATQLMKAAIDFIRRKRMKRAVLHVISTNVSAKNLYVKLGFEEFEKVAYFVGDLSSLSKPVAVDGVHIRSFHGDDLDAVYEVIKSSEDPKHLEIFCFRKTDLKSSFFERVFRFYGESKIVALYDNRIIGYAQAVCTTANEAGRIRNVHVCPEMKSKGVEEMLVFSVINEIMKVGTKKALVTASSDRPELIAATERLGFKKNLEMEGMTLELP
jgi:ribosomal protein S18 acetylase RimI-like enzyme